MSIPNSPIEIKPVEPETVTYVGEGQIVSKSPLSKYFWLVVGFLVVLLVWGTIILIQHPKPNVTIEYDSNLTPNQ